MRFYRPKNHENEWWCWDPELGQGYWLDRTKSGHFTRIRSSLREAEITTTPDYWLLCPDPRTMQDFRMDTGL